MHIPYSAFLCIALRFELKRTDRQGAKKSILVIRPTKPPGKHRCENQIERVRKIGIFSGKATAIFMFASFLRGKFFPLKVDPDSEELRPAGEQTRSRRNCYSL